MADIQCDLIVLTWNHLELTKKFFDSLLAGTCPVIRVIVVDNASTDGTKEYLKELKARSGLLHEIDVISNEENVGFVRGVNQGFARSSAPYVCLVNNDVIFTDGWLGEILSVFAKHPSIGILNPNSNTLGLRSPKEMLLRDFGVDVRKKFGGIWSEMLFCSGFCMVMRRDILDKNKGLSDEFIPMFFEDTDISMKAKELGYRIGVAKGAYVWHREHGSFKQGSEIEKIFAKSRQTFLKKWGKTLRIAWIEDNEKDLLADLKKVMEMGLQAHFVTFYVRGLSASREDIFKTLDIVEHSAVSFKKFRMHMALMLGIVFKKKKFDLIVVKNEFLCFVLRVLGQRAVPGFSKVLIDELREVKAKK